MCTTRDSKFSTSQGKRLLENNNSTRDVDDSTEINRVDYRCRLAVRAQCSGPCIHKCMLAHDHKKLNSEKKIHKEPVSFFPLLSLICGSDCFQFCCGFQDTTLFSAECLSAHPYLSHMLPQITKLWVTFIICLLELNSLQMLHGYIIVRSTFYVCIFFLVKFICKKNSIGLWSSANSV